MNKSSNLFILIAGLLAPVALILSAGAVTFNYFPGDLWFSHTAQLLVNPALTAFCKGLSWIFGDWRTIILAILAWLLVWKKTDFSESFLVLLAGAISLINGGLKAVIDRPRPAPDLVQVLMHYSGNSFPSGHAFFTVLFLGILTYLFFIHVKRTFWRAAVLTLAILIVLMICFARVYLGLHWFSDVLGGAVYGGFFLFLLIGLAPVIKFKTQKTKAV